MDRINAVSFVRNMIWLRCFLFEISDDRFHDHHPIVYFSLFYLVFYDYDLLLWDMLLKIFNFFLVYKLLQFNNYIPCFPCRLDSYRDVAQAPSSPGSHLSDMLTPEQLRVLGSLPKVVLKSLLKELQRRDEAATVCNSYRFLPNRQRSLYFKWSDGFLQARFKTRPNMHDDGFWLTAI